MFERLLGQVVDLDTYLHGLPESVEAFFYTEWASDEQKAYVRAAHGSFASRYRKAPAPLLMYDPNAPRRASGWPFAPAA